MRLYTAHVDPLTATPDGNAVFVREGFNWWAFLFSVLWSLRHGLWLVTLLILAIEILAGALTLILADPLLVTVLHLAVALYVGASANDWHRWTLRRRGRVEAAAVAAPDRLAAEHRFISQRLAPPTPAPTPTPGGATP